MLNRLERSALTLAFGALITTAPTFAADAADTREGAMSVSIRFSDLDLRSAHDQNLLDERIVTAVRNVCSHEASGSYFWTMINSNCYRREIERVRSVAKRKIAQSTKAGEHLAQR